MTTLSRSARLLLVVVLTIALSACSPGEVTGTKTKRITVYFTNTAGLFVGNEVGILGVTVGEVTAIDPEGEQVKVTLEIDADQPVPADAGAVVVARSVATDRYVELTPVFAEGDEEMADGAQIAVDATRTPVEFDEVLAALNTFATGIAGNRRTTNAVRNFINSTDAAIGGKGPLFNLTLKRFGQAVGSVSDQRENASATLVSLDDLVAKIAQNQGLARTFIRQVTRASDQLDDERFNLRTALRSLSKAVETVARFATDNRGQIVKAIDNTSRLGRVVLSRRTELTQVLRTMPLALQNLRLTLNDKRRVPVRVSPSVLLPLGDQITALCARISAPLCELITGTSPGTTRGGRR